MMNYEIATHLSGARNDEKRKGLAMTRPSFVIARHDCAEAIPVVTKRLPRTLQVLAMTKKERPCNDTLFLSLPGTIVPKQSPWGR
jgi:hypothetical protein